MHGYSTSASPAGEGGAARLAAAGAGISSTLSGPDQVSFFVWLVVIGVVIPGLILGALRIGGIHFVFKGRR